METKLLSKIKTKTSIGLIHRLYITQLKNKYTHTASTKTKSEVRGGGRKPWKQKGTGNARAGSIRSPLWAGGGVIFGPRPHLVSKKINKKEKRLAILSAFYLKNKETQLILNDTKINESIFKTKDLINYLNELKIKNSPILKNELKNEKILFILEKSSKSFWLATRNLKNITITTAKCLNISDLLHAQHIFLSNLSLKIIQETYGKLYI